MYSSFPIRSTMKRLCAFLLLCALIAPLPSPRAAEAASAEGVATARVVLRKTASTDAKALQTIPKGDDMKVLSVSGSWYRVRYGRFSGYVMKKYVKLAAGAKVESASSGSSNKTTSDKASSGGMSSSAMKGIDSIGDIGDVPNTSRKGDSGTKVKKLQMALTLKGYYAGAIDGSYGDQTEAAVKKFQRAKGMSQDGIAGPSTIRILFGEEAPDAAKASATIKTEQLDWFNDKGTSVIPRNAKITIKDVRTGKTFTAVRWAGTNHLDAEPANSEQTAILKSIYGGTWSWNRRPILVKYNGHVYAASMNGMPHGTSTISNGFNGHFCIHFKNSKTHESKKVDALHQAAVTTASKATW